MQAKELVERLREMSQGLSEVYLLMDGAADEIERLRHDLERAIDGRNAEAREAERLQEWERMFTAFVTHSLPTEFSKEPLWPNPNWSQDVAMVAHALASNMARYPTP